MSKYRVHVHDHADQGRWLAQQDFARRPTQEQVTAAFPVLSQPGRYEVRLGLLSGENEINAGGWLQGEPAPAADPGKAEVDPQRLGGQWRGFAHLVRYRGQHFVVSTAGDPDGSGGFASQVFRSDDRGHVTDWDEVAGGPGMSREQAITDLESRPVAALGYIMSRRDVMDQQEAEADAMTAGQFAAVVLEQTQKRLAATYPDSDQWSWERVQVIPGPKYTKVDVGPEHNMSGKYMIDNATGEIFGIKGYGRVHKGHPYGTLATVDDWYWGGYVGQRRDSFRPVNPDLFGRTAPKWNCVRYPLDGPHYPSRGNCLWCGKSAEKIAAEWEAAEGCCENCQG